MNIAILGTGNVGGALGVRLARLGHTVIFGSRDPHSEKMATLLTSAGPMASAADARSAAASADVVILATPWHVTEAVVAELGSLAGKVLIDTTNPLLPGLAGLSVGLTTSGAELVAAWAPGARVVKAFNHTGSGNMADPDYAGQQPDLFICGDDASAKDVVADLTRQLGFTPIDAGDLSLARALEPLALLWVRLAYVQGMGVNIAFKLLQR